MTTSETPAEKPFGWRRVSPVAVVYFFLKLLNHAVNLWPALIPLIAGGEFIRDLFWGYLIYAIGALSVLGLFINYWFFRFHEEENCIHIRTGMLNRSRLTLNYERVQQADIVQPFYFRPFGLATLGLESAGSTKKEVALPGIPYDYALKLKKTILEFKDKKKSGTATTGNPAKAEPQAVSKEEFKEPSYRLFLNPAEVARYGLMHNGLIFLLPLIAPLTQNPQLFQRYLSPLENTWLFDYLFHTEHQDSFFSFVAAVFFLALVAIVILFLASIGVALFRFWNYDLQRIGDQFQYRAGLATINTRGFRLHKLQKVVIAQGVVARLLQRSSLTITKAGASFAQAGAPQADKQHFLVPVLDNNELQRFMAELKLPDVTWHRVSPYHIVSTGGLSTLFFGGGLSIFLLVTESSLLWLLPMVVAIFLIAWRRWYCWGLYHDGDWFAVKTGFVGRKLTFVPAPKAQKTAVYQPLWLRKLSSAQIGVWSGAGAIYVPPIKENQAHTIRDRLLWQVVNYKKRWF